MSTDFEAAVAREEENRLLACLDVGRPLFGRVLANLTWRHFLELSLAGSPLFSDREAAAADIEAFLWRLGLHFSRPDGSLPNWPAGLKKPSRFARWRARVDCYRISRSAPPSALEVPVRLWIAEKWQDAPRETVGTAGANAGVRPSKLAVRLGWLDSVAAFYRARPFREVLDYPVAFTLQVMRAHDLATDPQAASRYVPRSASLVGDAPHSDPSIPDAPPA